MESQKEVGEVRQESREVKTSLKEVLTALMQKINELEQRIQQQEKVVNAFSDLMKQLEQRSTQTTDASFASLFLKSLLSENESGGDKMLKIFIAEMLKTNLLLQRVILQGFAKELGVRLRMRRRKDESKEA